MKRYAGTAVVLGLIGLAATALLLWWLPADDYLFVPDRAKPLAGKVEVQGGRPNAKGDVYYTDVFVRRIRKLEQLLPFTRPDGATFVPAKTLAPDGTTDAERDRQNAEDMQRSEQIAAVVALRALGYQVTATPRGVLVTSIYTDVPAAKVLEPNDVIVGVNGVSVVTPAQLRREISGVEPGDDVGLTVRRGDKVRDVTVKTVADPQDPSRAVDRHLRRPGREDRTAGRRRHRPRPRRWPIGRPSLRTRDRPAARPQRDAWLPDRRDR